MAFRGLTITKDGLAIMAQAHLGSGLLISKVKIGDGSTTKDFMDVHDLIHVLYAKNPAMHRNENQVFLELDISSNDGTGYYFREIGIYAKDTSNNEVLYAYDNAGEDAEYIAPIDSGITYEKRLRFCFIIDSAINVTISTSGTIYALHDDLEGLQQVLTNHEANKSNPHGVTKKQVGLEYVPNVSTNDQTPTYSDTSTLSTISTGEKMSSVFAKIKLAITTLINHLANKSNPHEVTKTQVGLNNVSNDAQVKRSEMGAASGVATLDTGGKVPSSQLPSYVDDVLEYTNKASFPNAGESGKIYVDKSTNITWRWSGSSYVEISKSLAIGETSSTAYPGDKGKATTDVVNKITKGTTTIPKATNALRSDVAGYLERGGHAIAPRWVPDVGVVFDVDASENLPVANSTRVSGLLVFSNILAVNPGGSDVVFVPLPQGFRGNFVYANVSNTNANAVRMGVKCIVGVSNGFHVVLDAPLNGNIQLSTIIVCV